MGDGLTRMKRQWLKPYITTKYIPIYEVFSLDFEGIHLFPLNGI
jgi:hypothetical protein